MDRKRQSALRLLEAFPQARFILFGDSGEQDLELYQAVARARPDQVLAIYIRDITTRRAAELRKSSILRRPMLGARHSSESLAGHDGLRPMTTTEIYDEPETYIGQNIDGSRPVGSDDIEAELTGAQQKLLRRATMWDERVAATRKSLPSHIPLVLFDEAEDVMESAVALVRQHSLCT